MRHFGIFFNNVIFIFQILLRTPTVLNLLWIKSSKPSLLNCMFQINNNGLASSPVQNWLLFHSVVDKKSLSIKEQTLKKRDLFMLLWRIHRFLIRPWWMQQKWYLQKIPTWIHKCFWGFTYANYFANAFAIQFHQGCCSSWGGSFHSGA